jgi:hypothetical protein
LNVAVFLTAALAKDRLAVANLSEFLWDLSARYRLTLYRFDTSDKPDQDDRAINELIESEFQKRAAATHAQRKRFPLTLNNTVYGTEGMLEQMQQYDLGVCARFHSHVFATLVGLPFLSICHTRKVELLTDELGVGEVRAGPYVPDLLKRFDQVVEKRHELSNRLLAKRAEYALLLDTVQADTLLRIEDPRPRTAVQGSIEERALKLSTEFAAQLGKARGIGDSDRVAEELCFRVTRDPHSRYVYGTKQNLRQSRSLPELIKWLLKDQQEQSAKDARVLDLNYISQDSLRGLHRSGWQYVLDYLRALQVPQGTGGVLLDCYVDRTFHWASGLLKAQGLIPYTSPWIGFVHHSHNTEFSSHNTVALLESKEFQQSLSTCYGLIVLSQQLADWLHERLPTVPLLMLHHPTAFVEPTAQWNLGRFIRNPERSLVQIGAWLRNPWTLPTLEVPPLFRGKLAIKGIDMDSYFAPEEFAIERADGALRVVSGVVDSNGGGMCRAIGESNRWIFFLERWLNGTALTEILGSRATLLPANFTLQFFDHGQHVEPVDNLVLRQLGQQLLHRIASVRTVEFLGNAEFDKLLSENVVFIDLVDASAVNTIIECTVRNTPILVNPLPAVVEYLGPRYPLYWQGQRTAAQLRPLLARDRLIAASVYLSRLDKSRLRISHFMEALQSSAIYKSLLPLSMY